MAESDQVLAKLKKEHGELIGHVGVKKVQVPRIPTDIFALDLATGGGFPQGRVSIVYGPESCGKTTLTLKLIAQTQKLLGLKAAFIDLENTYDPDWATSFGVNSDEVIYIQPDNAEQAVDAVEALMCANDVGLVVVDSIAAMVTNNEIEKDASTAAVGGASQIIGKMVRKGVSALGRESKRSHLPALVLINQVRHKIGVVYGDPEYFPGGNALKFASSLTVRLYGKDEIIKDVNPLLPAFKHTTGIIKKYKMSVVARSFEYDLCLIPHKSMKLGDCPSWTLVSGYLKKYGLLTKNGTKWVCMGIEFDALYHIQERYDTEPDLRRALQQEVVSRELVVSNKADSDKDEKIDPETGEILEPKSPF